MFLVDYFDFQFLSSLHEVLHPLLSDGGLSLIHELEDVLHVLVLDASQYYQWICLCRVVHQNGSEDWTAGAQDGLVSTKLSLIITDQGDVGELFVKQQVLHSLREMLPKCFPSQVKDIHHESFCLIHSSKKFNSYLNDLNEEFR